MFMAAALKQSAHRTLRSVEGSWLRKITNVPFNAYATLYLQKTFSKIVSHCFMNSAEAYCT